MIVALGGGLPTGSLTPVSAQETSQEGDAEEADTIAPTFESARTNGTYVIVTFSENITVSPAVTNAMQLFNVPIYRFFKAVMDVTVDGQDDVLSDNDYISGNELWLELTFPVSGDQELTVSYDNMFAVNGAGIIVDSSGNAAPFFSDKPVTNNLSSYETPDRTPVFTLSTQDLRISEGNSATYTVSLIDQPSDDVTINVTPHFVQSTPTSLTFTADNWDTPQTVTVSTFTDHDSIDAWAIVRHYRQDDRTAYWRDMRVLVTDTTVGGL